MKWFELGFKWLLVFYFIVKHLLGPGIFTRLGERGFQKMQFPGLCLFCPAQIMSSSFLPAITSRTGRTN